MIDSRNTCHMAYDPMGRIYKTRLCLLTDRCTVQPNKATKAKRTIDESNGG
ncbi:unnamed protein product [Prunus brigantina]